MEEVCVGSVCGNGVSVCCSEVVGLGRMVNLASIVCCTCVKLAVGMLIGWWFSVMRLITCHSKKMMPPATSSQINTVSKLNRTGDPLLVDMLFFGDSQPFRQDVRNLASSFRPSGFTASFSCQLKLPWMGDPGF